MDRPLRVLSLGAGVQSSTLLLMSIRGELPKLDAAVFADTQWEPRAVYDNLAWLEEVAGEVGIPVHRVTGGNLRQHTVEGFVRGSKEDGERYATMPMFVSNGHGGMGQIKRQCTREYKIEPLNRFMRAHLLELRRGQVAPRNAIEQWRGISADEARRARGPQERWCVPTYPLIGLPEPMLPRPYTRQDCVDWLSRNYPNFSIPRSSCLGCPFHSDAEWRQVKSNPEEWADVVEVDRAIRYSGGMRGDVYLHRSGQPLEEVDLSRDVDRGQGLLFGSEEECTGYCGT